ncbi:hypothetical protein [Glycomyces arizonensis]|uniref:hypothetical protein n=1 Tax=Glycomyces arizonensis TaxID=256035 RepID=UPI000416FACB|nr:hypothetical protein [Glycomyces arizonensis]
MSEQQSGAGYPQQPTSGQPQQQGYPPQYASPQAQYQAQQQYAAYAPQGPSFFDRLGVPSMPAILGLAGLAALVLSGLIAGTSDSMDPSELGYIVGDYFGGIQTLLVATVVMFALTLFGGERLRALWKTLTVAAVALFLASFLYRLLSLSEGNNASDASSWIGAILLLGAMGLFLAGALMAPLNAEAAAAKAASQQQAAAQQQGQAGYATGQQGGAQQTQQNQQWPQAPQQ